MKKYIHIVIVSLVMLFSSCSKDVLEMRVPVLPDNDPRYYITLLNLGALIDNVRPHPGKTLNLFLYYTSVDPVSEVKLLGKIAANGLPAAQRYTNLQVIHTYSAADAIYSRSYGADSLFMSWDIPSTTAITSNAIYYRIAVKTVKGMVDTTAGDYWQVIAPYNVATLSAIMVNGKTTGLTPAFTSSQFNYVYNVGPSVTAVPTVTVTETNASSNVTITPAISLTGTEAERTTVIKVVSESGATTNYYKVIFVKTQ